MYIVTGCYRLYACETIFTLDTTSHLRPHHRAIACLYEPWKSTPGCLMYGSDEGISSTTHVANPGTPSWMKSMGNLNCLRPMQVQLAMPQSRRTMSPANDFRAEKGWKVMLDFACCIFIYNIYIYIFIYPFFLVTSYPVDSVDSGFVSRTAWKHQSCSKVAQIEVLKKAKAQLRKASVDLVGKKLWDRCFWINTGGVNAFHSEIQRKAVCLESILVGSPCSSQGPTSPTFWKFWKITWIGTLMTPGSPPED